MSIRELETITGFSRDAITRRKKRFGLGDDFLLREICDLKPLDEAQAEMMSLEEARTLDTQAATKLKDRQIAELDGRLADVDELLASEAQCFEKIAAIIKRSRLDNSAKEDLFDEIRTVCTDLKV